VGVINRPQTKTTKRPKRKEHKGDGWQMNKFCHKRRKEGKEETSGRGRKSSGERSRKAENECPSPQDDQGTFAKNRQKNREKRGRHNASE